MKTILKTSIMAVLISVVSVIAVQAQRGSGNQKGPSHGHELDSCHIQQNVNDMDKALDLSDDQEAAILHLYYDQMAQMKEKRQANQGKRDAEREVHMKARKAFEAQIKEQLSPEQAGKYDAFIIGRRGANKPRSPKR